jgi:hypothetical protein
MTSAEARPAASGANRAIDRDELRARLYVACMLPLGDVALRHSPALAGVIRGAVRLRPRLGHTQWRVPSLGLCVGVRFAAGRVDAGAEDVDGAVPALRFASAAEVCAFFAALPPLAIARQLARHPLAFAPVIACLTRLRVLAAPATVTTARDRALYVDAALCLIALGLSQMARAGHPAAANLARSSPHRVYQWSVGDSELASYWRVERGRTRAGRGVYAREPHFVHVRFANVDAAFRALSARTSQMERLRSGDVETTGSPEYARQVTELLWDLDQLLLARS